MTLLLETVHCAVCSRVIEKPGGRHHCKECAAAIPYVTSAQKAGRCPMCLDDTDLYHSPNFYALDWAWCYRDAVIATTRFLP